MVGRQGALRVRRLLRVAVVVACLLPLHVVVARAASTSAQKGRPRRDADLVLVLPATDHRTFVRERAILRPWLRELHLMYALVPLRRINGGTNASQPSAEDVRGFLRAHFTHRSSSEQRPRYLGLLGASSVNYTGTPGPLPVIPRFDVQVQQGTARTEFETDLPYGFLDPVTVDNGDGSVDATDLDMTSPTFEVFRVPITRLSDLDTLVRRHDAFARSASRNDATLVAGTFGLFPGDTSTVQCATATALEQRNLAAHVFKVFDAPVCSPHVQTAAAGPHLADFLAGPTSAFRGGTVVDVSHGGPTAIYAGTNFFTNLSVPDVATIPANRLNVFISIACDNDGPPFAPPNLAAAMYARASVAVISATTTVTPTTPDAIKAAEIDSIVGLYEHPENLLQRLHAFRADYYERFVRPTSGLLQQLNWVNLLAVNLVGDGLVTVAR